ncbi:MAG: hypothetical protein ACK5H2_09105 [Beutenbergiaceae bacterium]
MGHPAAGVMGVMRRVVFPVVRLLIWAVIAVALCVIAFRQTAPALDDVADDDVVAPGADFTDPVAVAPTDVTANADGTAVYFAMPSGRVVTDGEPLMTIRGAAEPAADPQAPAPPRPTESTVHATADGEITFEVELNQSVARGDVVARIDEGQQYIAATMKPASLYRLLTLPPSAEVTITDGPAPFMCTGPRLVTTSGQDGASATELRCDIPSDVVVLPGLELKVSVLTDTAQDALVVPLTAVSGSYQAGSVWLVDDGGEPVETAVALGLTDGEVIQVTDGLEEGDTILQFVPGEPAQYPDYGGEPGDDLGGGGEELPDGGGEEPAEEPEG